MCGRQDRLLPVFHLEMSDLLLDLRFEFVGSPLEFVEILADLAGDFRQLLGPENHEGQKEQEDRLGKAHALHDTVPGREGQSLRQRIDEDSSRQKRSLEL